MNTHVYIHTYAHIGTFITTYKKQTGYALFMYVYVLCMYVYEKHHLLFQKEYYIIINNIHTHTYVRIRYT